MRIHGIYSAASYARGRPNSDLGGDHTLGLATVYGFASFPRYRKHPPKAILGRRSLASLARREPARNKGIFPEHEP
jgi:hypothetical protein